MSPSVSIRLAAVILALVPTSCAPAIRPAPAAASPTPAQALVADRLFFGRAIPGGGTVSEEEWAAFLDEVVTPRFPEGLTVWRAEGQWTGPRGELVREPVMVVEILHAAGTQADPPLAEIAREYKRRFRQDAVLRVTAPAHVLLYDQAHPPSCSPAGASWARRRPRRRLSTPRSDPGRLAGRGDGPRDRPRSRHGPGGPYLGATGAG